MKRLFLSFLFIAIAVISFSQNIRMYAETGGQGIKFGVLSFDNDFRKFKLLDTRELNIGLSDGIGVDGNVAKKDMDRVRFYVLYGLANMSSRLIDGSR